MHKVAIIGSGPSGFYAAQALFKLSDEVSVDMFDQYPTPFGLLRGGVAPDHQQMKTVATAYHRIAKHANFRFFGNVTIGRDLSLDDIRSHYSAVIVAVGAQTDRRMGIPGEDLPGSYTATEFVAWYNGQLNYQDHTFNLKGKNAVIIGQGNVAVDVVRILAKPVTQLQTTDITNAALMQLAESQISDIYMVGRRGPTQAAFTELELKELGHIEGVDLVIHDDLELSSADQIEVSQSAKSRKNMAQLQALKQRPAVANPRKTIHLMFYASPIELQASADQLGSVRFQKNTLVGEPGQQRVMPTEDGFDLPCDVLFRSIGYRGVPFEGLPFDDQSGTIRHDKGQVVLASGEPVENMYVTGWIKRGPTGVIGTNRSDSIETVTTCFNNLDSAHCQDPTDIVERLTQKNVRFFSYDDWLVLDAYEQSVGKKAGKPREKLTSLNQMLNVLAHGSA